jgi:hypothetical protein
MQLIAQSPKSPNACRIAVVTADGLLAKTMEARTASLSNIRILRTFDDLQSLVNTLVSNVTEEFVAGVRESAERYFFSPDSKDGLVYKEKIRERITQQYGNRLEELPKGASVREDGPWYVVAPSFVEKRGQRITWRTTIEVEAKAFKLENSASVNVNVPNQSGIVSGSSFLSEPLHVPNLKTIYLGGRAEPSGMAPTSGVTSGYVWSQKGLENFITVPQAEKVLVAKGHTVFHVTWSVTVTARGKLTRPKVHSIEWKETAWH